MNLLSRVRASDRQYRHSRAGRNRRRELGGKCRTDPQLPRRSSPRVERPHRFAQSRLAYDAPEPGGASETFVFKSAFGHATIADAHSHWTGAPHDIIDFATSEFANFAALFSDSTFSASGTRITKGTDHFVIEGITSKTGLTAANVLGDFKLLVRPADLFGDFTHRAIEGRCATI